MYYETPIGSYWEWKQLARKMWSELIRSSQTPMAKEAEYFAWEHAGATMEALPKDMQMALVMRQRMMKGIVDEAR